MYGEENENKLSIPISLAGTGGSHAPALGKNVTYIFRILRPSALRILMFPEKIIKP